MFAVQAIAAKGLKSHSVRLVCVKVATFCSSHRRVVEVYENKLHLICSLFIFSDMVQLTLTSAMSWALDVRELLSSGGKKGDEDVDVQGDFQNANRRNQIWFLHTCGSFSWNSCIDHLKFASLLNVVSLCNQKRIIGIKNQPAQFWADWHYWAESSAQRNKRATLYLKSRPMHCIRVNKSYT